MPTDTKIRAHFDNLIADINARLDAEQNSFRQCLLRHVAAKVDEAYGLFVDLTRRESCSADLGQHN